LQAVDAGIFFGRDEALVEAVDTLRGMTDAGRERIFVILGASGEGKSSFMRAGLLPRLARDRRHFIPLPVIRPGKAPLHGAEGLASALSNAFEQYGAQTTKAQIRAAIAGGADQLRPLLKALATQFTPQAGATSPMFVFAIDQAEELFDGNDAAESEAMLTLLGDLARADDPRTALLFTTGWDAYAALRSESSLDGLRHHAFALPSLSRLAYRSIIEGPLARVSPAGRRFEIEPALIDSLLDDLDQTPSDRLPLLAFTLEQLYRACGPERRLTQADYEKFGRLSGSIDAAVGRVLAIAGADPDLPKDREARLALLRRALIPWLACVDPRTDKARRRIASAREIPLDPRAFVELLVEERLATRRADKNTGEVWFELAHDALLREWTLLKAWIAEEPRLGGALEGVRRAAREWEAHARARSWMKHRGAQLDQAERLYAQPDLLALLDSTDRAYLVACRESEKNAVSAKASLDLSQAQPRRKPEQAERPRRFPRFSPILAFAALCAVGLVGWGLQSTRKPEVQTQGLEGAGILAADGQNRIRPEEELRRSQSVALNTIAQTLLGKGDTDGALKAARESIALMEALLSSNPSDAGWRRDLSISYERLGDALAARGDFAGALKSYREDLAIADALSAADPTNAQLRWDVSISEEKVAGALLAQGDSEGALASYRKSRAIREALTTSNPDNSAWRRDLAVSYERIGETLAKRGDVKGAIASFEGALAIYQSLTRANPDDAQTIVFAVAPHWRLADLDKARAREHLEAALAILEPLETAGRLPPTKREWMTAIRTALAALDPPRPATR
jgi:tetratricopeptide (TPR) repeat protein